MMIEQALARPFIWDVRVYHEDTDSGGVVYYANYLKFAERARTEWLRALGFEQTALARVHGVIFVVLSAGIDYVRPARARSRAARAARRGSPTGCCAACGTMPKSGRAGA